ncbi:MAG TPA: hypothetical protein VFO34_11360 [Candidatus Acidoferrales bacterium]|nr:hypothetical protein [Candidatus Acidoferrales bacterium]
MLGPLDYFLWFLTTLLQAGAVFCAIRAKCFLKFLTLNIFLIAACVVNAIRYYVFLEYGAASQQYGIVYYYSDTVLTIFLYFALMSLFLHVFRELGASAYIRTGAGLLLVAMAGISFFIVHQSQHRLFTRFAFELSQVLYFVGAVLTYLLWGAVLKLKKTQTRIIQIILALGIYFSAFAASYALGNIYGRSYGGFWRVVCYAAAIWLPVAWAYAFLKFPATAQLAPAQLAARAGAK